MNTLAAAVKRVTLDGYSGWIVLLAVGVVIILCGIVIIVGRRWLAGYATPSNAGDGAGADKQGKKAADPSHVDGTLVRSWIAISLVAGLLIFCAVAFSIDDTSLRSTLFGGLIASVGAAVAFYFSSKGSDKARQDILSAALGTAAVPNLVNMTVAGAHEAISKTPFLLVLSNPTAATEDTVTDQSPDAGTNVRTGSKISVSTVAADKAAADKAAADKVAADKVAADKAPEEPE